MLKYPIFYVIAVFVGLSCCSRQGAKKNDKPLPASSENKQFRLEAPQNGKTFMTGEAVQISLKGETLAALDSCVLLLDGKRIAAFNTISHELATTGWRMGVRRISIQVYANGTVLQTIPFAIKMMPKAAPAAYTFRVVREYPHDNKAYTQGLCFHKGFLYEGTGQLKASTLRKVKLETGSVLQSIALGDEYFGEGICVFDEQVIQLTWLNHLGFIYQLNDFTLKGTFKYPTEGWGLTTDGTRMWMSDGTATLYLLNPTTLEVIDQFEVYSNKGPTEELNELEYINNEIWANVYTKDHIVRINPSTGEVVGIIDLNGILKKEYYKPNTDVLNGIAYDSAGNRLFVTGKNWPKLFEIKVEKK